MTIKEISDLNEMLTHFEVIQQLYPKMSIETYASYLSEMLPNNYTQIAVFENDKCIAISGCWLEQNYGVGSI